MLIQRENLIFFAMVTHSRPYEFVDLGRNGLMEKGRVRESCPSIV